MGWINTDGLVLLGSGSEWFWSMAQFVVVAVTLIGIYYQLRLARSANAFAHLTALEGEWASERLMRKRLAIYRSLRELKDLSQVPASPAFDVAGYWEKVGSLIRAGHVAPRLVEESLGIECRFWWAILAPKVQKDRTAYANDTLWEQFEWTAAKMRAYERERGVTWAFDRAALDQTLEERIASHEVAIRDMEAMRAVLVASPGADLDHLSRAHG